VGLAIPVDVLKWVVAAILLAFGVYRLFRHRHPRYGGMRVSGRQLAIWSFLMATAHGAGLMVLPFVLGGSAGAAHGGAGTAGHAIHAGRAAAHASRGALLAGFPSGQLAGLGATLLHTGSYLLVTGAVAFLVFRRLGLRRLRQLWWNLDLVWAGALILTALLTPLL
jgi:hypothetical protein